MTYLTRFSKQFLEGVFSEVRTIVRSARVSHPFAIACAEGMSTVGLRDKREEARAIPLPSEIQEVLRRSSASAMTPNTTSARVAAKANSDVTGGPLVSGSPVAVGLVVAVGLAVTPSVTVTLPTMPRSSCGMQK